MNSMVRAAIPLGTDGLGILACCSSVFVSVFYSEITKVISLNPPKLIDLPGFGQEFLIIFRSEDIHGSNLRTQVMDNLLQIRINRHVFNIAQPSNSDSTHVISERRKDLLPGKISPRKRAGLLPGPPLISLSMFVMFCAASART